MIGRGGGRGQSALDCDDECWDDDVAAAIDHDVRFEEEETEEWMDSDDDGAGSSATDICSASCAASCWEQAEIEDNDGRGIISEDEHMSQSNSSHLSSFDDSSMSSSSYDVCESEGDLVWSDGE